MALRALGHEITTFTSLPDELPSAQIAIVNLSSLRLPAESILPLLRASGIFSIGHAGHKEKTLLEQGRASGCDIVVSNGRLTHKLDEVLTDALAHMEARREL